MPRTKGTPNPVFAKLETTADTLAKAREALEKKPNDPAAKKAVETAAAAHATVNTEVKRHRFLNTTVKRAENVVKTLGFLGKSFDRKQYEYTPDEAKEILATLTAELAYLTSNVETAMTGKSETKGAHRTFSFQ